MKDHLTADNSAATKHRTTVTLDERLSPPLFDARCSCGWQSKYLMSDPEAAGYAAHLHTLGRDDAAE